MKNNRLDPHEAPPQPLKDLFKFWKGSSSDSIAQLDSASHGIKHVGSIPIAHLQSALENLSKTSTDNVSESASVYGSDELPGRECSLLLELLSSGIIYNLAMSITVILTLGRPIHFTVFATPACTKRASFMLVASRSFESKAQDESSLAL